MLGSIRSAPQRTHLSRSRRGRSRPRSGLTTGSGLTSWRRPLLARMRPVPRKTGCTSALDPKPPDATVRFGATKSRASIFELVQSFLTERIKSRFSREIGVNPNAHLPTRRKFPRKPFCVSTPKKRYFRFRHPRIVFSIDLITNSYRGTAYRRI
jgi:hypothetical protein